VRRAGGPPVVTLVLAILPAGLHGIPDTTFLYASHVRGARSNCNERLVSNDVELSRVWGPCCGMSYRLTNSLVLDRVYACTRGSIRAGRNRKRRLAVALRRNSFCLAAIGHTSTQQVQRKLAQVLDSGAEDFRVLEGKCKDQASMAKSQNNLFSYLLSTPGTQATFESFVCLTGGLH
jgi:hypothetical protein